MCGRMVLTRSAAEIAEAFELETTLELERTYPAALQDLARCLAAEGRTDEAIALLGEAIDLNPRDPEIYSYLGKTCREAGQSGNALEAYRSALRMLFPPP